MRRQRRAPQAAGPRKLSGDHRPAERLTFTVLAAPTGRVGTQPRPTTAGLDCAGCPVLLVVEHCDAACDSVHAGVVALPWYLR